MRSLTLLALLVFGEANVIPEKCDVKISETCYKKEILNYIDRAYSLRVDYFTNTLYFSRNKKDEEIKDDESSFVASYFNLNDREISDIDEKIVEGGFAQAIDPKTHDVYIGGANGIFKFDHKTKTVEEYAAKDKNIWSLYYHDDLLYYINFPENFIYTIDENKIVNRFKDLEDVKVDSFAIDGDNDIIFTNDTGIFKQRKGTKDASVITGVDGGGTRALATNKNGVTYLCGVYGIAVFDKVNNNINTLIEDIDCYGITFDNGNNMIYSDFTEVVRLVGTN